MHNHFLNVICHLFGKEGLSEVPGCSVPNL